MNTLTELLSFLKNYLDWALSENAESNAGLPVGSSTNLANLSRQTIDLIEQAKTSLIQLNGRWNEIMSIDNSTTSGSLGQNLLNELKTSDQALDQTIGIMAYFQTELAAYEAIVKRKKAQSETDLSQAKAELANIQTTITEYNRAAEDARRRGDLQTALSFIAGGVISDRDAQTSVANKEYFNLQLLRCTQLLDNLGKIAAPLNYYRNLANAVDSKLEDAVSKEEKALNSTRETLSAYYNRQVGRELNELFALL